MIGEILKEIIIYIQVNSKFCGNCGNILSGDHLDDHCIFIKCSIVLKSDFIQKSTEILDIIITDNNITIL